MARNRSVLPIFGWIALGLASGLLASPIVGSAREGVVVDIPLGIGGAIVGGKLFAFAGASGLDVRSLMAAVIGASAGATAPQPTRTYASRRASQHPTVAPATRPAASRRNASVQSPGGVWSSARGHGSVQTSPPTGWSISIRP